MTFGHIAHYNQSGFYSEFFESTMDKVRFLEQTRLRDVMEVPSIRTVTWNG